MSGWGCLNELKGKCLRVEGRECDPGMMGCILFGRFVFSTPEKNISRHTRAETEPEDTTCGSTSAPTPPDRSRDQ